MDKRLETLKLVADGKTTPQQAYDNLFGTGRSCYLSDIFNPQNSEIPKHDGNINHFSQGNSYNMDSMSMHEGGIKHFKD